jgi:hypothetical protein
MNGMEHMGLVDGSTIGEGAMSLSGPEWCQWLNLGYPLCTTLFYISLIYHNISKCNRTDGLQKSDLKYIKAWSQWCITLPGWLNCEVLTILYQQITYREPLLDGNNHWWN